MHYNAAMQIAKIRKRKKLTQTDLAEMLGVEQPTISRLERKDGGTTLRQYIAVAEALDVTLGEIFASDREIAEMELLQAFRSLSLERQAGWLDMARLAAADPQEPSS